jgi:hypothetical protein
MVLLTSRRAATYANILPLLPHLFVILKASGQDTYPKWLFVAMLHLAYLKLNDHPVHHALMADHRMAYEEVGEQLFSQLSRSVAIDPNRTVHSHTDRAFKGIGAYREMTRNFQAKLGNKVGASRARLDAAVSRTGEKDLVVTYLRDLLVNLKAGVIPTYIVGDYEVTAEKIAPKAAPVNCRSAKVFLNPMVRKDFAEEEEFAKAIHRNKYHKDLRHHHNEALKLPPLA